MELIIPHHSIQKLGNSFSVFVIFLVIFWMHKVLYSTYIKMLKNKHTNQKIPHGLRIEDEERDLHYELVTMSSPPHN